MQRSSGCRITSDLIYNKYRAVLLENEKLQIILLLDRGGEPIRWLHKPTDTDFIWKTRLGLQPPHALFPDYQMTYPGGWQEMMPEVSYTHTYRGTTVHRGETAVSPWEMQIIRDEEQEVRIRLTHRVRSLPLYVEKDFILRSGETTVRIEETVKNEAPVRVETNWGYHLAYGAPFINENSRVHFPPGATVIQQSPLQDEWPWPNAVQDGVTIDLTRMPPRGTHRDLMAVKSTEGVYTIENPDMGLGLKVRWDQHVWPYVWYWQNFGSDGDAPFFSVEYNIGLEMFNIPPKLTLAEAAAAGLALELEPFGSQSSWLEFEVKEDGISGR